MGNPTLAPHGQHPSTAKGAVPGTAARREPAHLSFARQDQVSGTLQPGDLVLLTDRKGRRYLLTLVEGGEFHTHAGLVPHDELIGGTEGMQVRTTRNAELTVWRPTLRDYVLKMPRGAQVVYPKDSAAILMHADVFPGARILESGVGSGALSLSLLRAGAVVVGYEVREDFAQQAVENVTSFLGSEAAGRFQVEIRDCYQGIDAEELDRVVLDLPEPWRVVPHAAASLHPGGILVAYTPSIIQAVQLREACETGPWAAASTVEILHRGWHIKGDAVRPEHRMVGHTGFVTTARKLAG
ncbi:MAG: tRNA (adenine-N1)-methyltransferase [Acidimicrobiia bacterium]|nr:tRNA (adenine-N1)-methyltransferase [Acidimicrobiia bacterium]